MTSQVIRKFPSCWPSPEWSQARKIPDPTSPKAALANGPQSTQQHPPIMNSFRFARAAIRARPAALKAPAQRRTYAEAIPDKASPPARRPLTRELAADRFYRSS